QGAATPAPTAAPTTTSAGAMLAPGDKTKVYDFAGDVLDQLAPNPPPKAGPLSKATLRYAIRSIQPLLLEGYATATSGKPAQHGTLNVQLRLDGAPDEGTLVESVEITSDDMPVAKDPELVECMRETLSSIELPAMTEAATWDVNYPYAVR